MATRARDKIALVLVGYMLVAFGIFVSSDFVYDVGAPRYLPLPWSGFHDFVEASDGTVYVYLHFYSHVLRYDRDGRFLSSRRAPGYPEKGGRKELAADVNGRVYLLNGPHLYIFERPWDLVEDMWLEDAATFVLSEDGPITSPEAAPTSPQRLIRVGEPLFASTYDRLRPSRVTFKSSDGTILVRKGDRIYRERPDGTVVNRYGTAWWLYWAKAPFPVFVIGFGLPAAIAVGVALIEQLRAFWSKVRGTSSNAGSARLG